MTRGTCGKNLRWTLDDNGTLTISGTGNMEYYPYVQKLPWFNHREQIKNVIINDGVTSIGDSHGYGVSFYGCKNLKSVIIPNSVKKISKWSFEACPSLKEIYYPEGRDFEKFLSRGNSAKFVPYTPNLVSTEEFMLTPEPAQLTLKFFPDMKAKPAAEKLRWKVDGKTLTVGGVRVIKDFSREEPPWLDRILDIQKIIVEEGVEKISANAFIDCKRLELLTIPASVKTIGDMAFTACFCGNRFENGGRNVFWCVEDGVLIFKKNPAAKSDADFSTGSVSWLPVEKNITGFKLEPGVVPKEKFFEWLSKRGDALQASFA